METTGAEDTWSLRLLVLLLFVILLFIGAASTYLILTNTNWGAVDKNLAITMKLFYIYSALLGVCLLGALAWLVIDERKIRNLRQQLERRKQAS